MKAPKKGDDALVLITRPELLPEDFTGRTGKVIGVQPSELLLKFKGRAWPVSFPCDNVAVRPK